MKRTPDSQSGVFSPSSFNFQVHNSRKKKFPLPRLSAKNFLSTDCVQKLAWALVICVIFLFYRGNHANEVCQSLSCLISISASFDGNFHLYTVQCQEGCRDRNSEVLHDTDRRIRSRIDRPEIRLPVYTGAQKFFPQATGPKFWVLMSTNFACSWLPFRFFEYHRRWKTQAYNQGTDRVKFSF